MICSPHSMKRAFIFILLTVGATLRAAPVVEPEQASWAVLDQAAQAGNTDVRLNAVAALEFMGGDNQQAVDRLVIYLKKDRDTRVRKEAALALGRMKAAAAIPALKLALNDNNEVSFGAAQALMFMGDESGRPKLVAVLAGQQSAGAGMITNAKRDAGKKMHHPGGIALMAVGGATSAMLPGSGIAISALTNANGLRGKSAPGEVAAIQCLARDKDSDPSGLTPVEGALSNKNPTVRAEAAKGLGELGNSASIAKLQPLLKDRHSGVRTMAAASIIRISHAAETRPTLANETLLPRPASR